MSEDLKIFLEDLLIAIEGQEAILTQLKTQIRKLIGPEKPGQEKKPASWDPKKIKWHKTKGARGEYERYPAEGQKIEVSPDYKALLSDLKKHKMFIFKGGWNYWVFPDLATIGRKRKEAKE